MVIAKIINIIVFVAMQREYPEYYKMLCRKGFYPYGRVDGPDKLDYHGLPPMDAFYSK